LAKFFDLQARLSLFERKGKQLKYHAEFSTFRGLDFRFSMNQRTLFLHFFSSLWFGRQGAGHDQLVAGLKVKNQTNQ